MQNQICYNLQNCFNDNANMSRTKKNGRQLNMQSQSHIHTPHTEGIGISCGWGGGVCKAKHLEEYMKLNWNFCGGGMDFFGITQFKT